VKDFTPNFRLTVFRKTSSLVQSVEIHEKYTDTVNLLLRQNSQTPTSTKQLLSTLIHMEKTLSTKP